MTGAFCLVEIRSLVLREVVRRPHEYGALPDNNKLRNTIHALILPDSLGVPKAPETKTVTTDVPTALERVHRCMEENPEQPLQSASDLAALDALTDSSGYGPAPSRFGRVTFSTTGSFLSCP